MLQKERQNKIIELLKQQKTVKIKELAELFDVSIITIRRDFDILEESGVIKKIYGGAMLVETTPAEIVQPFFSARIEKHRAEKLLVASAAAALVQNGDMGLRLFQWAQIKRRCWNKHARLWRPLIVCMVKLWCCPKP